MPERILVVDDEPAIADTLSAVLRSVGYTTAIAYDAEQALPLIESFQPALVISDVVMAETSGVELAICLHSRYPHCKVVLFSGQATTEDLVQDARRRGYLFEVIAKPIHPRDLLPRISAILRQNAL